ncbi:MAG: HAD-IIIA family hydrolase [Pseudomonadota bacterium]
MKAAIVAGGRGTRLGSLAETVPKPWLPVAGRPLIARHLDLLAQAGIDQVTVCVGHLASVIVRELPALAPAGIDLHVVSEDEPAGSAGCLARAFENLEQPLLVIFGDVVVDMDLAGLLKAHRSHPGCSATVVVHPNDHPQDSDLVELDGDGRVQALHRKPHPADLDVANLVVAGVFVLEPELLRTIPRHSCVDLVHDLLPAALERGQIVAGHRSTEYLKDMGTPERYAEVQHAWSAGVVARMRAGAERPVAFLDRDGTLNRYVGLIAHPDQIELLPGAAAAVRRLNRAGVCTVVVTNQPVVARGLCDEALLDRIHGRLEMLLGRQGAFVDRLYYCPHHPDRGFSGENPAFKIVCDCRKPAPGLIRRAQRELGLGLRRAAMFGDSQRDFELARSCGIDFYWLACGEPVPAPQQATSHHDLTAAVQVWLDTLGQGA